MIASNDSFEPSRQEQLPNSKRVYVNGTLHPGVRVAFREISQNPTKSLNGDTEENSPVRVYDTSGPWGDPDFDGYVAKGLPAVRNKWIRDRADVEEYDGREAKPLDNGYLSSTHAKHATQRATANRLTEIPGQGPTPRHPGPGPGSRRPTQADGEPGPRSQEPSHAERRAPASSTSVGAAAAGVARAALGGGAAPVHADAASGRSSIRSTISNQAAPAFQAPPEA